MSKALLVTISVCLWVACQANELTSANFEDEVQDGRYWLVAFSASWCKRCKPVTEMFEKLTQQIKSSKVEDKLAVAMYDTDQEDKSVMEKYEVEGLPGIVLIKPDGKWLEYTKDRDMKSIKAFLREETGVAVKKEKVRSESSTAGRLLELTHDNYTQIINNPDKNVLVKFWAPWCRACTETVAVWNELAEENTDEDLVIAKLNCELDEPMKFVCWEKFTIRGYPAIMV